MPSSTPTHVFIVRHGARLDMADAQWQLSSPTPYDPPLTYGGWTQTRSLGSRIATLIANRLNTPHPASTTAAHPRKIRIVIHSSPFLRCIQTSVSIASGIAQHHHQEITNTHYVHADPDDADGEGDGELTVDPAPHDRSEHQFVKPLLRLDAWLGEWLAEDYYTDITPPPPTPLLVGSAKADYIRPPSPPPSSSAHHVQHHHVPSLYNMSSLAAALPPAFTGGFVAPTPTWATSPNGPIPRGYFSHAKQYAEFDIGWDSTRLGGGGEYKEEWTAMHKRFKNGWNRLLWYYATEDPQVATSPTQWKRCAAGEAAVSKPATPTPTPAKEHPQLATAAAVNGNPTPPLSDCGDDDGADTDTDTDTDIETVLILVTHGAGCNALIGAITHQPVLIDIGIASVTMAVRRDHDSSRSHHHHHHSHSAPPTTATTDDAPAAPPAKYALQIVANNEHIRTGATPTSTPPVSPHLRSTAAKRTTTIGGFTLAASGAGKEMAMFGHHGKRSASTASSGPAPKGLWSRPVDGGDSRPASKDESVGSGSGIFGSSSMLFGSAIDGGSSSEDEEGGGSTNGSIAEEPAAGTGLWGSTSAVRGSGLWGDSGAAGWERKRRWTASTRSEFQN
ncbi:uncharacterized protein H6S33_004246 [Morchella sextelata]|uniref:uncharacterized protein n=1 Tax=Morchella sextelata TaxID=1174677 RepID=UPI001D036EB5|nr:uncharacterized protein H6S33_004246 [Morchella sextelata]KAH0605789.1 hypothetical protein H6S33_004246 [Morchella sextelata]